VTAPPNAMFTLHDRVAVVTGAARGIGARIAAVLAEAGASVVIADLSIMVPQKGPPPPWWQGVGQRTHCASTSPMSPRLSRLAHVVADYGAPWLLVNNAGLQDRQLLLDATVAEWDRINAVNTRGPFLMTRELGQAIATAGKGGRIVNIASNVLVGSWARWSRGRRHTLHQRVRCSL
jgi:NAD(P)-dependent dehydrogenase (short-subunit alcohol dehydrogenase family)